MCHGYYIGRTSGIIGGGLMRETLTREPLSLVPNPGDRVFGHFYSMQRNELTGEMINTIFTTQEAKILETGSGWLPRIHSEDLGVLADLYKDRKIVATLTYLYRSRLTNVYVTGEDGEIADTLMFTQLEFDDAVEMAEKYASTL